MTYDLALYTDGGEEKGRGHLMRTLALVEAALRAKLKVVVVVPNADLALGWPCPVYAGRFGFPEAKVTVADGWEIKCDWAVADDSLRGWECGGVIYPHPGKKSFGKKPVLRGPEYYPLRTQFRAPVLGVKYRTGIAYRLPGAQTLLRDIAKERISVEEVHEMVGGARYIVCPPSVIAYEAMAMGTAVCLHDGLPQYEHISKALIKAGWAERWYSGSPPGPRPREPKLDGLGADRIIKEIT